MKLIDKIISNGKIKLSNVAVVLLIIAILVVISMIIISERNKPLPTFSVAGVIESVEYVIETGTFFESGVKQTVITFQDGRMKAFKGIVNQVLQKGRLNKITYDKNNRIVEVIIE